MNLTGECLTLHVITNVIKHGFRTVRCIFLFTVRWLIDINHVDLVMFVKPLGYVADFADFVRKKQYLLHLLENIHDIQCMHHLLPASPVKSPINLLFTPATDSL